MKIGIDMGHCLLGADTSARGVFVESDYNRRVGNLVIQKLKDKGHTVINCTIDSGCIDMYDSLGKRVNIANNNNVDIYCSIHFNGGGGEGTETYLANRSAFLSNDTYNKNYAIAKNVNDKVVSSCNFKNRGVKHEDFYVIYNTKAPAILVEVCFCDSKNDFNKLNVEKVAIAICEGLTNEDYSSVKTPTPTPTVSEELYRVRKSWVDVSSQVGAYKSLENAKKECDSRNGYFVFNSNGARVYPVTIYSNEYIVETKPESGNFTCTEDKIYFRNNPLVSDSNPITGNYTRGENVNYDKVVTTNKYIYISWISASTGTRRYMPVREYNNGVYGELWGTIV